MNVVPLPLLTMFEVAVGLLLVLRLMRHTKYEFAPRVRRLTAGDWALATAAAVALTSLHAFSPWLTIVGYTGFYAFLLLLWLDVALYGCFTFELGLGGARDVVISNLAAEVFSMRSSRQFFWTHRTFLLVPLVLPLLSGLFFLTEPSAFRLPLEMVLALYFGSTLSHRVSPTLSSPRRRALWFDFLSTRRPRIPLGFTPRPEHAALLASPSLSRPTHSLHGRLRGRSIVLLTFESLGMTHLQKGQAHTPFLSSQFESKHGITSAWHASPAPLTNAAHVGWYFGQWSLRDPDTRNSHIATLAAAGYRTIYLTPARTAHFGLAAILKRSGFTQIIDGDALVAAGPEKGALARDSWIESVGLSELETSLTCHDGPFFLHIHAQNAHVPHLVEDPQTFARHDNRDDYRRFLNAVEETDDLFGRLIDSIRAIAQLRAPNNDVPIVIVSSDHGQSFGEHNYRSHASAVTAEQIQVPLAILHPLLPPISAPFSTHFDILPTLLDLVGLPIQSGYGQSLLKTPRSVMLFLFDGQPSRPTSTCLGLIIGQQKYSLDLVRDTLVRSNWNDEDRQMLDSEERDYFEALIGIVAERRGVA